MSLKSTTASLITLADLGAGCSLATLGMTIEIGHNLAVFLAALVNVLASFYIAKKVRRAKDSVDKPPAKSDKGRL